jgi:DNA-binding NarL/FixJ family response regulator
MDGLLPPNGDLPPDLIRIIIVDDHPLHSMGLNLVLGDESDIEVVGTGASGAEALRLVATVRPRVVVMDVKMPGTDGIETTRRIKMIDDSVEVLALSGFDDEEIVISALRAGASGYVLKDAPFSEIAQAIRHVASGQSYLTPSIARRVLQELQRVSARPDPAAATDEAGLTARETQVLSMIGRGLSNREIGEKLTISERTVENHIRSLYGKLGVRNRSQALLRAVQLGLTAPG